MCVFMVQHVRACVAVRGLYAGWFVTGSSAFAVSHLLYVAEREINVQYKKIQRGFSLFYVLQY